MSEATLTGSVLVVFKRASALSSSRGLLVPLSIKTQRAEPSVFKVRANCARPVSSFEPTIPAPACRMLGERSRSISVSSGRPPPVKPSQPPAKGRLITKMRAAIASTRIAKINHCRSLA